MSDLMKNIEEGTARLTQVNQEMELCLKLATDFESQAREQRTRYADLKSERAVIGTALAHNQVVSRVNSAQEAAEQAKTAAQANQAETARILASLQEKEAQLTETLAKAQESHSVLEAKIAEVSANSQTDSGSNPTE